METVNNFSRDLATGARHTGITYNVMAMCYHLVTANRTQRRKSPTGIVISSANELPWENLKSWFWSVISI
jgi:Iap family predicted aminopeptidase